MQQLARTGRMRLPGKGVARRDPPFPQLDAIRRVRPDQQPGKAVAGGRPPRRDRSGRPAILSLTAMPSHRISIVYYKFTIYQSFHERAMIAAALALAASVLYGAGDFLAGMAARRTSLPAVIAISQLVGL